MAARAVQAFLVVGLMASAGRAAVFHMTPDRFTAGEPVIVNLTIPAPEGGIAVGGKVRLPFYLKPWNGLPKGLTDGDRRNDLVNATRTDGGAVEAANVNKNPQFAILSDLEITIRDTPLAAGERLSVRLGSEMQKVWATRKQRRLMIEVQVDSSGSGEYRMLEPPEVRVAAGEPERLFVAGPSQVVAGQATPLVVWAEDRYKNVVETLDGEVQLVWAGGQETGRLTPWDPGAELDRNEVPATFATPGIVQVEARFGALTGRSNPIEVVDKLPARRLYWGDIHVHTQISDGRGELADAYREAFARGHDFLAITDHGFGRGERGNLEQRLRAVCEEAERFNRPARFIAIPAGETHYIPQMHMNLYFVGPDMRQMTTLTGRLGELKLKGFGPNVTPEQRAESARRYWAAFDGFDRYPLAFPHHTMWTGNQEYMHPTRQRLVEVFSTHGTSETRVQDDVPEAMRMKPSRMKGNADIKFAAREQLDRGFRLGFAGGSDNHEGQPGQPALTGLWADELSREGILEALWSRRCFATSGERTVISLSADAAVQGEEVAALLRQVRCQVLAERPIERLELVSGGQIVYSKAGEGATAIDIAWGPAEPINGYVYARAILRGTGGAWSSPIWFGE